MALSRRPNGPIGIVVAVDAAAGEAAHAAGVVAALGQRKSGQVLGTVRVAPPGAVRL